MKASKFLNIFIPAVAGASIVVAPVSTYIVNSGIFRFQVQVDSLQDCATLSNKNATVGHDYVTNVEISGDYELDKFDIKVGGVRIPKKGYAYSPARKQLVIYGNYITSQDLSIAVDVKAKQATADFETDSWDNVITYCNRALETGSMTEMELHYGRSSFVGLERTIDIQRIRNGPIIPHKVRVIGQQADYEFETHKPIALTFEFETVISFDDGVGFSLPYTAPRNGVSRWLDSNLRAFLNGQNGLPGATPTNIYEAIKSVSKRTNAGNGKVDRPLEASEKYFAPSIWECFSHSGLTKSKYPPFYDNYLDAKAFQESMQYEYYVQTFGDDNPTTQAKRLLKFPATVDPTTLVSPAHYWYRTPVNDARGTFFFNASGYSAIQSTSHKSVAPLFCI